MSIPDDDVMARLRRGIRGLPPARDSQSRGGAGPVPRILLISCSDPGLDPARLGDIAPGELFVVRNLAGLVPPFQSSCRYDSAGAGIEYAVRDLGVAHIVVLGHAHCSGIATLLRGLRGTRPERDFVGNWMSLALDACFRYVASPSGEVTAGLEVTEVDLSTLRQHQHLAERAAIRGSLANLSTYPWIQERVAAGRLDLVGWWFDLDTGDLWSTDSANTSFLPLLD